MLNGGWFGEGAQEKAVGALGCLGVLFTFLKPLAPREQSAPLTAQEQTYPVPPWLGNKI